MEHTCTTFSRTKAPSGGSVAETWRRVWGGRKIFSANPRFLNDVFWRKISIFAAEFSDDLFFIIDQISQIFPFFSQIFPIFFYVKCHIWPFPHKKNTFFYSVRTFTRILQHYFSKYWGNNAWAVPQPQIFGEAVPPVPPRSPPLRGCKEWKGKMDSERILLMIRRRKKEKDKEDEKEEGGDEDGDGKEEE